MDWFNNKEVIQIIKNLQFQYKPMQKDFSEKRNCLGTPSEPCKGQCCMYEKQLCTLRACKIKNDASYCSVHNGLAKLLKKIEPDFGQANQRTEATSKRDVGTSFEPRIEVDYRVYFGDEFKGVYTQTAVLEKDGRTVVSVAGRWSNQPSFDKIDAEIVKRLRREQCPGCRDGTAQCNHTREELMASGKAFAFIENTETGEVRYHCCIACALLKLTPDERTHVIESQFNREGHYEKLQSAWSDIDKARKS